MCYLIPVFYTSDFEQFEATVNGNSTPWIFLSTWNVKTYLSFSWNKKLCLEIKHSIKYWKWYFPPFFKFWALIDLKNKDTLFCYAVSKKYLVFIIFLKIRVNLIFYNFIMENYFFSFKDQHCRLIKICSLAVNDAENQTIVSFFNFPMIY